MKNMKKSVAILLAVVLLVGVVIGGTLAWFTDKTQKVENTFTVGNIDIELDEDDNTKDDDTRTEVGNDYKMIPGWTITKDPVATVVAGSEDCYLFVKLDKSANFDDFMTYEMADGWTKLADGVYYREVTAGAADQEFHVIKNDTITVKDTVTKAMMDTLGTDRTKYPTLNVTAYATQLYKNNTTKFEPAEAWAIANP